MEQGSSEPLSNVSPETLLYYTHELTRTKRRIYEANSAHRHMVKRAKEDGVPTNAILESIVWAKLEPEERHQRLIDRIRIESARYPDNGERLVEAINKLDTRVSDKARADHNLFTAEQRGYDDGRLGVPADANPFQPGSESAQIWRRYWHEGQKAAAQQLGEDATMASARKQKEKPQEAVEAKPPRKRRSSSTPRAPRKRGNGKVIELPAAH